jgi:hypothetical protein
MAKKRPTLDAFLNNQNVSEKDETASSFAATTAEEKKSSRRQAVPRSSAKPSAKSDVSKTKGGVATEKALSAERSADVRAKKAEIIRHMLYLPLPVYDQLQELIFEEQRGQTKRRKTHDYLLDAIDLLFERKGLRSITELTAGE